MAQKPDPGVTRYTTGTGEQRWRVTYDLLPGPDGQRRRTTKRGFRTVREANRFRHLRSLTEPGQVCTLSANR